MVALSNRATGHFVFADNAASKQRVNLTAEGRSFLRDAKRMLALGDEVVESVRQLSQKEAPALNIGYVADLFYDLLPNTLASFQRSCPTVAVNLFDMSCGDQFRALHEGRIDLGFVGLREAVGEAGLEFRSIASYETVVAVPNGMQLVKQRVIKLKDLESMFF